MRQNDRFSGGIASGWVGLWLLFAITSVAATTHGLHDQVRQGGTDTGGGVIPGPAMSFGSPYGGAVAIFAATRVRVVNLEGAPYAQVLVVVRDASGDVVAAKFTDVDGQATIITSEVGTYTVDAIELGVCDVPFVPGTKVVIVIDE